MDTKETDNLVRTIHCNGAKITLVGTAHVSKKSVEMVEEKISAGDFDCVAVELCQARYENMVNKDGWKNLDIFQVFRERKAGMLLVNMALSAYQRRLAEKVGVEAGKEMARAVEMASEKNIRLEVVDRNISVTLQRMTHKITFWQKMRLFTGLVAGIFVGEEISEEKIEELKTGDMLHSVVEEFSQMMPDVKKVLIDERDQYMTGKLVGLAHSENPPKNILALVGAGHLNGMLAAFDSPPQEDAMKEMDEKPRPSRAGLYFGWGIGLFILSMFYVGFRQSPELGWSLFATWVLVNGTLSALGAAIAFAHPLSILTAFIAAPITSLNPTISAGIVVGLVESYLRKPRVGDFETLRDDLTHWKMWWKNGVVRVFLVFFFANLGSMVGTWLAGASIVHQLVG